MNPEKPNNFSNPEQTQKNLEKGVVIKIEARKAKDILDDLYYGEPDYGDYDYPDEPHEHTEKEKKESLPYLPFDASQSLHDLRKLSPEEKALPLTERRELLRSRLEALKDNLRQQNIGIASIIRDLQKIVEVKPDTAAEELLLKVREVAPQYRLSEGQLNLFNYALEDYEQKHKMVEKYRTDYPEDADLFEACFGRKPVGEVKVIKLPMTLHFQCFSLDDYALAYNQFKLKEDASELTDEDKRKADLSGGAALASVRIEDLKGVVTIENTRGRIVDFEQVPTKRTENVKETPLELYLPEQKENIQISAEGDTWELQFVEKDERGEPLRLRLVGPDGQSVFDARFVEPSEELKEKYFILYKILEDVDGEKAKHASMGGFLKSGQQSYGYYHIQGAFLKLDAFSKGLKVDYTTNQLVPIMSKEGSERIRIHEEQHQFNKLFIPWEIRLGRYKIMMDAAERAKTPQEAKEIVVRGLVKERRQDIVDRRARDEVIAYYRDGRNTDEIFTMLTESPLYDYLDQSKERVEKLPEEIVKEIEEEMSEVVYQKEPDEEGFADYVVDAIPLQVDEDLVRKNIEPVFKDEYKKDLRRWLDAVALLERKGYQREEIVSLLTQEPARNWSALSRRLLQKELVQ